MAVAKTLEDIISEQASIVCEQIEAAVAFADSEEDLRIEVEKAIEVFRKEADLPEIAAKVSLESYSHSIKSELTARVAPDDAFQTAKGHLQKRVKTIWDWDEDVTLLNLALVAIGP